MKYNQELFISKCKFKHNDIYDYSSTKFVSSNMKIDIICKKHGIFNQLAKKHLSGNGCPKCANENHRISQEEFLKRSIEVHNNKYNYDLVVYVNHSTKVQIICPDHGIFLQSPNNHMIHKKGCPSCNGGVKYTEEVFLQKVKEVHGEKFKYNITDWKDCNTKIEILCEKNHKFMQIPKCHLRGQGCPKCKLDNIRYNNEKFSNLSKIIHDNKYDYSLVEYKSSKIKVSIKCNRCNDVFFQDPRNHLSGQGCPKCCNNSISKIENLWLDYLEIPDEFRHKTIRIGNKNFFVDALIGNTIYEFYGDYWHGNPNKYDMNELNKTVSKKFGELFENTRKREIELLNNGYKIISIWESDFKKLKILNENI